MNYTQETYSQLRINLFYHQEYLINVHKKVILRFCASHDIVEQQNVLEYVGGRT